jgi:predicted TIM-barrel fold metal-dependent hydrolase
MKRKIANAALLLAFLPGAATFAQQSGIGYKPAPDAESKKTILLKDFQPKPALHATAHEILRAKFPVIDVHTHTNDAAGIGDRVDPKEMVARMDQLNIKTIVILTGMWGDKLQSIIDRMVKPYPGRFLVFQQIDWSKINEPNFSELMVRQLDDSVRRGARGLKILKELGLGVRDSTGKLITIDDPRLDPVWEECGRLGIPVFIHAGDPEAFFHPIDAHNERYEELIEHPDWSFLRPEISVSAGVVSATRSDVRQASAYDICRSCISAVGRRISTSSDRLCKHFPNVMIETGAREGELGRQPRRTRELFMKYSDRIMLGTDEGASEEMYRNYFRWFETEDEYFPYAQYPQQGRWMIYGLGLPDDVLEKVYHENAEKLFAQFDAAGKR